MQFKTQRVGLIARQLIARQLIALPEKRGSIKHILLQK